MRIDGDKFSRWLTDQLIARKLTQGKFSTLTGISNATISRHLAGKRQPTEKCLQAYSAALNVPIDDVYRAAGYIYKEEKPVPRHTRTMVFSLYKLLSTENKKALLRCAEILYNSQEKQ